VNDLWFAWPAWWPWLLLVPPAVWLADRFGEHAERRRCAAVGPRDDVLTGVRRWARTRRLLDAGALALVGIALLQPIAPGDDGDGGADVVLCVDVSWSMACRDASPTRLAAVQQAIDELARTLDRSRMGLVAFAGTAALRAPLTTDGAAVAALARELAAGADLAGGTDPGAAVQLASDLLDRAGAGGAIVVLGDGEDFVGNGSAAAARAAEAGHVVHTFGVGDPAGSKIVVATSGGEAFLRDGDGQEVVSRLELANLRALAAAGGGRFERLAPGALGALHDTVLAPAARAAAVREGRLVPVHVAALPLLAAFLLWMLRACLRERSR